MKGFQLSWENGQDLLEYALIVPVFLLILVVITDLGRATYYSSAIRNAAREGARFGIIEPCNTAGISTRAESKTVGLNPAPTFNINTPSSCPDVDVDETIRVCAYYDFTPITPLAASLLGANTITLDSCSTMRVEY